MEPEVVVEQAHPFDDGFDDESDDVVVQQYHSKSSIDDGEPNSHNLFLSRFDNNIPNNNNTNNIPIGGGAETVHQRMLDDDDDDDAVFSPSACATGDGRPGFFSANLHTAGSLSTTAAPAIHSNAKSTLQASLAAGNNGSDVRRWTDDDMSIVNVDVDDGLGAVHQQQDNSLRTTNASPPTANQHFHTADVVVVNPSPVSVTTTTNNKVGHGGKDALMSKDRLLCMHYANFRRDINPTTGHLSFMSDCLYCHRTIAGVQKYVWRRSCIRHLENIHKKPVSEAGFRPIGGNPGEARFSEQGDIIFTDNDAAPASTLMPPVVAAAPTPSAIINGNGDVDVCGDLSLSRASFVVGSGGDHFNNFAAADDRLGDPLGAAIDTDITADDQHSHYSGDSGGGGNLLLSGRDDLSRGVAGGSSSASFVPLPAPPPVGTDLSTAELVLEHYSNLRQEERTKGRVYVADCKYCRKAIVGHEKPTQVGHFREHTKKRHIEMPHQIGTAQQLTPTAAAASGADMLRNINRNLSLNSLSHASPSMVPKINGNYPYHHQSHFGSGLLGNSDTLLMWNDYFEMPVRDNDDVYKATCKLCKMVVNGSRRLSIFQNFSHHLRDQHKFRVSDSGAILEESNQNSMPPTQLFDQQRPVAATNGGVKDELEVQRTSSSSFTDALRSTMTNFAAQIMAASAAGNGGGGGITAPSTSAAAFGAMTNSAMADLASRMLQQQQQSQKLMTSSFNTSNGASSTSESMMSNNNMPLTVTVDSDDNSTPSKFGGTDSGGGGRNNSRSPTLGDENDSQRSESQNGPNGAGVSSGNGGGSGDTVSGSGGEYDSEEQSPGKMKKREEDNLIRQRVLEHYIVGQGQTSAGSSCCVGKCRHCNVTVTTSRKHIHIPKFTAHLSRHHPDVFSTLGITLEHNRTKITKKKKKSGSSLKSAHLINMQQQQQQQSSSGGGGMLTSSTSSSTPTPLLLHSKNNNINGPLPHSSSNMLNTLTNGHQQQPAVNLSNLAVAAAAAAAAAASSPAPLAAHAAAGGATGGGMFDANAVGSVAGSSSAISEFAQKFISVVQQQQQQNQLLNAASLVNSRNRKIEDNNNNSAAAASSSLLTGSGFASPSLLGKAGYLLNSTGSNALSNAVLQQQQQHNRNRNDNMNNNNFMNDFSASRNNNGHMLQNNNTTLGGNNNNHHNHLAAMNNHHHHRQNSLNSLDFAEPQRGAASASREKSIILLRYPFSHPHDPSDKCYLMVPTVAANELPTDKIRELRTILDREGRKLDASGSTYEIARDGITVLNKLESINFRVASMAVNATEYFWTLRSEV